MFYLLYGEDDFSLKETLAEIKSGLGDDDLIATNTSVFQAVDVKLEQLIAACDTVPFLAPSRLVIVEGLIGHFEQKRSKGQGKRSVVANASNWEALAEYIVRMPRSTTLVLIDGGLNGNNRMLKALVPHADVREFRPLQRDSLINWMKSRAQNMGCSLSYQAVRLLVELVGNNLWLMSNEIDKLCLHSSKGQVEESDVQILIANARDTNVFTMIDAVLEHRTPAAVRMLHDLEEEGAAPPYLLFMITRQFRLAIQANDLLSRKQKQAEIGKALGIYSDYPLRKTIEQARKYSIEQLENVYRRLLDTDISIKTGRIKGDKGELALDLLISDLCSLPAN